MKLGIFLSRLKSIVYMAMVAGLFATVALPLTYAQTGGTGAASITTALCGIIQGIALVIGVLAVFMFILGGVLYAFAHFLPAAGNLKGSMQGWGIGMLMGGIIMLILYVLAPFIVGKIISLSNGFQTTTGPNSGSVAIASISGVNCNTV